MFNFLNNQKVAYRVGRHLLFWSLLYLLDFSFLLVFEYPRYLFNQDYSVLFNNWHLNVANFLVDVAFSYAVVYGLYDGFRASRKLSRFVLGCVILLIVSFAVKVLISYSAQSIWNQPAYVFANVTWLVFIAFLNGGPPVKCLLFCSTKLLKDYYMKMELMNQVTKENSKAELQLLKAQVHPHFLFNTLNNIYSSILSEKGNAADLVSRLRNTLAYMLTDCQAAQVPLDKELEMILDYVELEKIRYGGRLQVQTSVSGNTENKMIHPLLLIPIVENCFKHGTSQMLEQSWISIDIAVDDLLMQAIIKNSKPDAESIVKNQNGIGINNVRKRIRLLYSNHGSFKISSAPGTYSVAMSIPLS